MWMGDDELNFTDEEARSIGHVPVSQRRNPTPRQIHNPAQDEEVGWVSQGIFITLVFSGLLAAVFASSQSNSNSSSQHVQTQISQQSLPNNQQSFQAEYFPDGWSYISASKPTEMYMDNQIYTIPQDHPFFVSLRDVNGFYLAVGEDASWNGWVKVTGYKMQIPMHPDFAGAKQFVEHFDWNLIPSSNSVDAPSQEEAETVLEALRASEAQTEGDDDMSLFQRKDKDQQEPAEITVQGEEAIIPLPPEPEDERPKEKKVKLPKTIWRAEGASAPPAWGCDLEGGQQTRCTVQDGRGNILFEFHVEKGCAYDGRALVCGN